MHIIVCIKQVPDPEGPRDSFEIDETLNQVQPIGIPPVLSLFDENALEAALRIKDAHGGNVKITALSMGKRVANAVMLRALASGADELLKVEDPAFESGMHDSMSTADAISKAIKKTKEYDLIFVGRQAADWNSGQVGIYIAGNLGIPCVTLAQKVEVESDHVVVERIRTNGYETVKTSLPAVVMVSNEIGELRYPAMKERREAKKKPVTQWNAEDIGFNPSSGNKLVLRQLYAPVLETTHCKIIESDTPEDAGKNLAKQLLEDQVIPYR